MSKRAAVIGGGPAGCAAASYLSRHGREVIVFERDPVIGGRTQTWRQHGWVVDSGAGFFTNFYPTLSELIAACGLGDRVVDLNRKSFLVRQGEAAPLILGSTLSFLRFPFVGPWDKARMLLGTAKSALRYGRVSLSDPDQMKALDHSSGEAFSIAAVGEAAYQYFVRPGVEPFWYFRCSETSAALPVLLQAKAPTARFYALKDGMDTICSALTEGLDVRFDSEVQRISSRAEGGFSVEHAQGEEVVDEVVIATTAPVACRLCDGLGDELVSATQRAFLASQKYVPNIHAVYRVGRGQVPEDMSAAFPCGPGEHPVAALNFARHKFQGDTPPPEHEDLVSVYMSGQESEKWLDKSDEALGAGIWRAAQDSFPFLRGEAEMILHKRRRRAIPVHEVGRFKLASAFWAEQKPPLAFAGDYLSTATVDGALASGVRAATRLVSEATSWTNPARC